MQLISNPVISNISLFRTFFAVPRLEYHPLIRTRIEKWLEILMLNFSIK